MNIFNLLAKEKLVAGLEINDSVVRVAFLSYKKSNSSFLSFSSSSNSTHETPLLVTYEEELPDGIVTEGKVTDPLQLGAFLKEFWIRANLKTEYAVVSIPHDSIYSRVFSFPKSINESKLQEAMKLGVSFQLPLKDDDIYLDWEHVVGPSTTNDILLSAIPKNVVSDYLDALTIAQIKPLALESHLASISRSIEVNQADTVLYSKESSDDATIFLLKHGNVHFARSLPSRFISKAKLKEEIKRIKTAFEADTKDTSHTVKIANLEEATVREEYKNIDSLPAPISTWLVALGAARRGTISEGNDTYISLLPIKTKEAYIYQKTTIFILLMRNIILGVCMFFLVAFLGMYIFILSLSQIINKSATTMVVTPTASESLEKESLIERANQLTSISKDILVTTPLWSNFLDQMLTIIPNGVVVTTLTANKLDSSITMIGTAKDRVTLNQFRSVLQGSPLLTDVILPITNLDQKERIPFTVTFKLKDTSTLYYK